MAINPIHPRGGSHPNKKYTNAAQSALQTIQSYKRSSPSPPTAPLLLSESALMDKETNAIYWQDVESSNILSTSLTRPYLTQRGVLHVRATVLFVVLWLWLWGRVSRWLCRRYFEQRLDDTHDTTAASVSILSSLNELSFSNPIAQRILSIIKPILQFLLLTINALLYLRPPPYPPRIILSTLILYLLESYGCSTRRYLSHAMNAPKELTEYLESLRSAEAVVKWNVRCFHYEEREIWKWILSSGGLFRTLFGLIGKEEGVKSEMDKKPLPSWMTRKVVTHQAVGKYEFGSCEDYTIATLWKRAQSFSSSQEGAPFSKLALSKLLVLKDKKAREDYFAQQAAFVMLEGRKDVNAEFATSIEVPGFCPKLLAVRPVPHAHNISASLFRLHIYYAFTLLGLSLPYRIWFAKHCDEIRISVVKETGAVELNEEEDGGEVKSSWLRSKIWGSSGAVSSAAMERKRAQELFRKSMQSFSLYEDEPSSMDQNLEVRKDNLTVSDDTKNATVINHDMEVPIEVNNTVGENISNKHDNNTTSIADTAPESLDGTARPSDKTSETVAADLPVTTHQST